MLGLGYYNVRGRAAAAGRADPGARQAASRAGATLDTFVVIFLILMIWKPGL